MPTATFKVCHLPDTRLSLIESSHNFKALTFDQPSSTCFVLTWCVICPCFTTFCGTICPPDSLLPPVSLSYCVVFFPLVLYQCLPLLYRYLFTERQ